MNKITTLFCAFSLALAASMALVACGDDSSSASNDEQPGSSNAAEEKLEEGKECPAESEGVYASVLDTLAVYEDGNDQLEDSQERPEACWKITATVMGVTQVSYYWGTEAEAEAQVDAIISTGMGTASYELAAATDPDSCHE